jgi:hypothetical protein
LIWQQRLRGAVKRYEDSKGEQGKWNPDFLLRGFPLTEALEWRKRKPDSFSDKEREFVLARLRTH